RSSSCQRSAALRVLPSFPTRRSSDLSSDFAVRVRPRASIANLSYMIARSGVAPVAITAFSRGYLPRFEGAPNVERMYRQSLLLRSEEHTSELQSRENLVCRLLLEKKK